MIISRARRMTGVIWLALLAWCLVCAQSSAQNQTTARTGSPNSIRPQLVMQTGHAGAVDVVALAPDGSVAVTGSADGSACLWEAATGREIRCLKKHEEGIAQVDYSSDGRMILTATQQKGLVRLWNPETGEEIREFAEEGLDKTVQFALFSPDARYVLTGGSFNTVNLWDAETGRVVRRFAPDEVVVKRDIKENPNPYSWPSAAAFSKDGRLIIVGGTNGVAHLWETETGKEIKALAVFPAAVHAIAFSPDARMLLVGGSDASSSQRVVGAILWNIETARPEKIFKHDQVVTSLAYAADGSTIMTSSDGIADGGEGYARVWDARTGALLHTIKPVIENNGAHSSVLSRDGRRVLMSEYRGASLWETATGKLAQQLAPYSEPVYNLRFTPDGKFLAIKGADVSLWSLEQGREVWREFLGGRGSSLGFAPDGKTFVAASGLYDAASGQKIDEYKFNAKDDTYVYLSEVSPDGRFVVTASSTKVTETSVNTKPVAVTLWDAQTGKPVRSFAGHDGKYLKTLQFSKDSKRLLTSGKDLTARLWDVETGNELRRFKIEEKPNDPFKDTVAVLSPDGRLVLTIYDLNRTARLWDAATGNLVRELKGEAVGYLKSASFAPDGKSFATGDGEGTTIIWDTQTGNILQHITGHVGDVNALAFSPDGRLLVTGGDDGTTRFWLAATGAEICRVQSFDIVLGTTADKGDHGWVVAAPDGRFDSNTLFDIRGMHWLMADEPLKPLPLEVFLRDYYEPRLLARLLANEQLRALPDLSELNRVQPIVKITDIKPETPTAPDTIAEQVTVTVEVTNATRTQRRAGGSAVKMESGVFDVRLFRDGQLVGYVPESDGAVKLNADGQAELTFPHIKLAHRGLKKVEFAAYAFNKDRVKSETDRRVYEIRGSFKWHRPHAYLISVGVNAYERDGLNLRYAANDARQMQDVVTKLLRERGAFEVVPVPLVSDYEVHLPDGRVVKAQDATPDELKAGQKVMTINQATKENVRTVLELLAGKQVDAEKLKDIPNADSLKLAQPDDMLILTFSAHGYAAANGTFYIVPSNTGTDKLLSREFLRHCISSDDLGQWLRDVDAGEMVMIVDACHSAAAVAGTDFKPAPMGSRGLGQLAYDKGMRILTATQTDNIALETNQIKQGLLSYALVVNGLKEEQANYLPKDEKITLAEWLSYGVRRVPELYAEMRSGKLGRELTLEDVSGAANEKLQQPSLFDFARRRRDVLLVNNF